MTEKNNQSMKYLPSVNNISHNKTYLRKDVVELFIACLAFTYCRHCSIVV